MHNYFAEGTVVDDSMRQSLVTDEEDSELESAMIKRSEIAMRGRVEGSNSNADALRQSIAGFPALFMSQADINVNYGMNQRILGMFMRQDGSEAQHDSVKRVSFVSSKYRPVSVRPASKLNNSTLSRENLVLRDSMI